MILTKYARFASRLFTGLFAGFLTGVLVLELSLRGFDGAVYTQVRLIELDSLDKLAVATLLPALSTTALLAYSTRRTNKRWPTLAALALLVLVVGLTGAVNLPINSDQLHWNTTSPPADWIGIRDRWQLAHAIRTTAAVLAFALLAAPSSIRPGRQAPPGRSPGTPEAAPMSPQRSKRPGMPKAVARVPRRWFASPLA